MIFYFSATGNSQHVAEKTAAALGGRVASIGACMRSDKFEFDLSGDDYLGFVLPTFAWTIPEIAVEFIEKLRLKNADGVHCFGILTAGAGTGGAPAALAAALSDKGIAYSGSFDVIMVDNFIVWSALPPEPAIAARLKSADAVLDGIIEKLRARQSGTIPTSPPKDRFMPYNKQDSKSGKCAFTVSDACTGCGTCVSVCPTRCIELEGKKPVWSGRCTVCLACLHRCPAAAIDHGRDTVGKKRYTYPGT